MNKNWLNNNTFHHSRFSNLEKLVELKKQRKLKISLCFPTLNEEKTIAKEIIIMKSELISKYPLLDEIVVIDSGSTDNTMKTAKHYGAKVFLAKNILPNLKKQYKGKGENLWKALYVTKGDIIVYIDADIKNIHHRFAYGLLGPLLINETIKYVKAFYDRPIKTDEAEIKPSGGGRVTELVVRPLFSLFYPQLSQIIQPLSGEYAGYREILDKLSFPIGYGIETSLLIDITKNWGLDVIAQVDLDKRVHRNQDILSLGKMSFAILQTFYKRLQKQGIINKKEKIYHKLAQFQSNGKKYNTVKNEIKVEERPPIMTISEYRNKYKINTEK